MSFWQNVEVEREYQGLSRKELAFKAKISYANIGIGLERGSIPVADAAFRIAKALGVTVEYLLTGEADARNITIKTSASILQMQKLLTIYGKTLQTLDSLPSATRQGLLTLIDTIAKDILQ